MLDSTEFLNLINLVFCIPRGVLPTIEAYIFAKRLPGVLLQATFLTHLNLIVFLSWDIDSPVSIISSLLILILHLFVLWCQRSLGSCEGFPSQIFQYFSRFQCLWKREERSDVEPRYLDLPTFGVVSFPKFQFPSAQGLALLKTLYRKASSKMRTPWRGWEMMEVDWPE